MREILFRGKSVDDGEWVFGSLVITTLEPVDDAPIKHYHIEDMTIGCFPNEFQSGLSETIDPNTVGQFTGLTDKNGKKIFEGDIVQYYGTYALEVFIENGHAKTRWFDTVTNSECEELFFGDDESLGECEVIGNIHDNPELLEVE